MEVSAYSGSGQCYCGSVLVSASVRPEAVAVCHCKDCRRVTGAAVPAFAAFPEGSVTFTPLLDEGFELTAGVRRWFCVKCGSPLAATFDYLPAQIYVPLGILDFDPELEPTVQCYSAQTPPWVLRMDSIPRHEGSARAALRTPGEKT